jgi:hypothetical protein
MIFKRFLRKIGRKERGMILPLALILLVAATLIVVPGLGFMYSLLTINSNAQQDVAAYYAADSGIQALYWYWNKNPNSITSTYLPIIPNPINGMTVALAVADSRAPDSSYDNYTITSSAASGGKTRAKVIALIQVPAPGNNIFNEAASSLNGDFSMTGGAHILSDGRQAGNYGNIYANGNITLTPSATVGGTCCSACNTCGSGTAAQGVASATGTATISNCNTGTCDGSTVTGAPPVSYSVNVQTFINQASAGSHYGSSPVPGYGTYTFPGPAYITGDLTIGGSVTVHLNGTVYCTGNLHIANSGVVDGAYTIVCGGNLTLDGSANANLVAGNIPFIICQGTTVTIGGSGQVAAVIYAPNADATLSGSAYVYGSVIAKSITMQGSAIIKYMSGIHSETQIPGAGLGGTPLLIGYNYQ